MTATGASAPPGALYQANALSVRILTDRSGYFFPYPDGVSAEVLPVRDRDGVFIDRVAWLADQPGRWWRRNGNGTVLGEVEIERAECLNAPLRLFATPAAWLANHRPGGVWPAACVIDWSVDPRALFYRAHIVCENAGLARRLDEAQRRFERPLRIEVAGRGAYRGSERDTPAAQSFEPAPRLRAEPLDAFLAHEIPPRGMLLAPWLTEKSLCMAHSWRGTGKTWIGLGIAYAVASGGSFLAWRAPAPRRVLHVDGEMPAAALQERLRAVVRAGGSTLPDPDRLRIIAADLSESGIPDLASAEGQAAVDEQLADADLLILDNLSTLCRGLRENEGDDWRPVQDWLLRLRRAGKSVLLLHHSGKGKTQRGSSRKEDVLDVVIGLRRPDDYTDDQGARFEAHFEKARGLFGPAARPIDARLEVRDGAATWTVRDAEASLDQRIAQLSADGLSQREIALETGASLGSVNRRLQKARVDGLGQGPAG